LTRRTCWIDHHDQLPIIEGTLIRLQVEYLPGDPSGSFPLFMISIGICAAQ